MRTTIIAASLALGSVGCGLHDPMSGTIVMTTSPHEAHVCVTHDSIRVGETLRVTHHVCEAVTLRQLSPPCRGQSAGSVRVVRRFNHYAIVRSVGGTILHEGDTVEATR